MNIKNDILRIAFEYSMEAIKCIAEKVKDYTSDVYAEDEDDKDGDNGD
ncbi:MAG: hypothetical protein Q8M92_03610 [Candidatus Subteraquimicrobiales bacterium]|nr:hypothetical protein [Candidatus Subteraquimicrobiales bacterium]